MSFWKHAEYRDSGIEWLGEVPAGWEVKRLKFVATINDDILPESTDPDFIFEYVDIGGVNYVEGISSKEEMSFENAPSRARRIVKLGDTIVSTVRTYLRAIASIGEIDKPLIVSTGFAVIRPKTICSEFLAYASKASFFVESIVARSTGVSYPAINASEVGNIFISVPGKRKQTAIASYLDKETAKIDSLVAKQEQLIELLREKRQAVISNAVTKGLNPNAKMKESGIEWLEEMPEGWKVKPLKYLAHINKSMLSESTDPDYEFDYVDIGSVSQEAEITKKERVKFSSAPSRARRLVQKGDVIVSTVRTYLRAIAPIKGSAENLVVSTGFCVVSSSDELKSAYCSYLLQAPFFVETVVAQSVGVGYPATNASDIANINISVPPLEEQKKIAAFLDRETEKVDILTKKCETAIRLLKERRTALISAAVTGKIDVRSAA